MIEKIEEFFDTALKILEDRNVEHGDSWKGRTGAVGLFCQVERKVDRLFANVYQPLTYGKDISDVKVALDTCIDLANYAGLLYIVIREKYGEENEG
jgi:hypothetical protein